MMHNRRLALAMVASATICTTGSASATPILGTPVAGVASSAPVGAPDGDGFLSFFIPLGGSGIFGVDGFGMTADTCRAPCGGRIDMVLMFTPIEAGAYTLTLEFDDLDITGASDDGRLVETVRVRDRDGALLAFVDATDDPEVVAADRDRQILEIGVMATTDPVVFDLEFESRLGGSNHLRNTEERVRASIAGIAALSAEEPPAVPEPSALVPFGFGLVVILAALRWAGRPGPAPPPAARIRSLL